jgi:hypothetical protein
VNLVTPGTRNRSYYELRLNYHQEESFLNSVVKRRVAGRVNHVDLGPVLEQDLQDGQVAAVAGQVDGHLALVVLRVGGVRRRWLAYSSGTTELKFPIKNTDDLTKLQLYGTYSCLIRTY